MAITYSEVFEDIGRIIKLIDQFHDVATGSNSPVPDLPDREADIMAQLASTGRYDVADGMQSILSSFKNQMSSFGQTLSAKVTERLLNLDSVILQLNSTVSPSDINHLLMELANDMIANSETINASSVGMSGWAAAASNVGDGIVVRTDVLDGVTSPTNGAIPQIQYAGIKSELSVPTEIMSLTCIEDQDTNNRPEGQELFLLEGKPGTTQGPWDWKQEGSGTSLQLPTLNTFDIVGNRDFEIWTATNTPFGWSVISGTPGTNILQETTAADVFRGLTSLNLIGNSQNIDLRQSIPLNTLTPRRMYCLAMCVKGSATIDGTLSVKFFSTSGEYTATKATFTGTNVNWADANPDTLTGTWGDGNNWILNGFTAGMKIQVSGASTAANNGTYTIASVTTTVITLAAGDAVVADATDAPTIIGSDEWLLMDDVELQAQTVYGHEYFFMVAPANIPEDLQLQIALTGATTGDLHIDSLAFGPVTYGNGVGFAVLAGETDFQLNDRFSGFVLNTEGLFQRYFRKAHRMQLPSDNAGGESIADTLISGA
jgi:hypothetical protein